MTKEASKPGQHKKGLGLPARLGLPKPVVVQRPSLPSVVSIPNFPQVVEDAFRVRKPDISPAVDSGLPKRAAAKPVEITKGVAVTLKPAKPSAMKTLEEKNPTKEVPELKSIEEIMRFVRARIEHEQMASFQVSEQTLKEILIPLMLLGDLPEGIKIGEIVESALAISGGHAAGHIKVKAKKPNFPSKDVKVVFELGNTEDGRDITFLSIKADPKRVKYWPIVDIDVEGQVGELLRQKPINQLVKVGFQEKLDENKGKPKCKLRGVSLSLKEGKLAVKVSGNTSTK